MQARNVRSNVVEFSHSDFSHYPTLPPQNTEAEEAILGGILLDPGAIARVAEILRPEAFYINAHQEIYKAMLALHLGGKPTDLMCVTTWLNDMGQLEKVGGQSKLAELVLPVVSAVNVDRHAELVMDKYHRRQLIAAGNEIVQLGHETATELTCVVDEAQRKLMHVTSSQQGGGGSATAISESLVEVFCEIESGEQAGYKTGLADLDATLGGLYKKDLIVAAGRPGMGKTWFGVYLSSQFLKQYRLPVVFFSAEMDKNKLVKRFLSMHSGVNLANLVRNQVEQQDWVKLTTAVGAIADYPLFIDDTPASQLTPNKIRSELRRIQIETGSPTGLVVLDYLQKLGDRKAANRAQVVGAFAGEAKDIAKEFDCPFVALAQINREVEGLSSKRPNISQIKDSGDIEQDADTILTLYRDEYYNPNTPDRNILEIDAAKNRNGPNGIAKVIFRPDTGFYGNLKP